MLVLTRKVNQQIRLGENVTITILRVQGNSIRIGVEAPREVRVVRGELSPLKAEGGPRAPEDSVRSSQAACPASVAGKAADGDVANGMTQAPLEEPSTAPKMLEFDLEDLDAETLESLEKVAGRSEQHGEVYQMRTTAPLARFFPPTTRESVTNYSIS